MAEHFYKSDVIFLCLSKRKVKCSIYKRYCKIHNSREVRLKWSLHIKHSQTSSHLLVNMDPAGWQITISAEFRPQMFTARQATFYPITSNIPHRIPPIYHRNFEQPSHHHYFFTSADLLAHVPSSPLISSKNLMWWLTTSVRFRIY